MVDQNILEKLKSKFIDYEQWINLGSPDSPPSDVPNGYYKVYSQNPEAYLYYRHYLYALIEHYTGEFGVKRDLLDLVNEVGQYVDVEEFFTFINNLSKSYKCQRNNTFEIQKVVEDEITTPLLLLYQSLYEIEEPLLLLVILSKALTEKSLDLSVREFHNKQGRLKKGLIIEYILDGLSKYPSLRNVFERAYSSKLRNTIGHNDYKIEDKYIKSLDNSICISKDEFKDALYNLQKIHNAIIWLISFYEIQQEEHLFKDCGVISIGFGFEGNKPIMGIYQLWCFYNIDDDKDWLDTIQINIEGDQLETVVSPTCVIYEKIYDELSQWLEKVKISQEVTAKLISIGPYLGVEENRIELDGEEYQIWDNPLEKNISIKIN